MKGEPDVTAEALIRLARADDWAGAETLVSDIDNLYDAGQVIGQLVAVAVAALDCPPEKADEFLEIMIFNGAKEHQ